MFRFQVPFFFLSLENNRSQNSCDWLNNSSFYWRTLEGRTMRNFQTHQLFGVSPPSHHKSSFIQRASVYKQWPHSKAALLLCTSEKCYKLFSYDILVVGVYSWFRLILHWTSSWFIWYKVQQRGLLRIISITNKTNMAYSLKELADSQQQLDLPDVTTPRAVHTHSWAGILSVSLQTMKKTRKSQLLQSAQITVSENGISQETTSNPW